MKNLRQTLGIGALLLAALAAHGCSDDKPTKGSESSGGESAYQKAKKSADGVHSDFKQEIKPVAGWVDDKSHRAADEARKGAGAEPREDDQD
jgi:hypothetical protein